MLKKNRPWEALINEITELKDRQSGILCDVGTGNGRNMLELNQTLTLALDISFKLLSRYIASSDHQRILGALPKLPIRRKSVSDILSVAVLHHLRTEEQRRAAVEDLRRINQLLGTLTLTVWRKWRPSNAKKIFQAIRDGRHLIELEDHQRPWKNSKGEVLAKRFYHYYTWKELYFQLRESQYMIESRKHFGGHSGRDNFFVKALRRD